jgi:DNA invertase Pin-like site-specific DNA recombinase
MRQQVNQMDACYLRLSLEDDEVARGNHRESTSIGSQRLCISEFVQSHSDMPKDITEFVDDGYSGTSMERPAMKKLLQLVTMGRIRTIIVRDLSRFARNYLEAGHYLEYIFPAYNVRFISINDDYDSAKVATGDSKGFELAVRNLLNDMYSRDISRKIKTSVDLKKMNGEYVYGQAPFGYKKGEKKNTIVVDEEAAEIVRRIFHLAVSGRTVTEIARQMNEEKVITPSVYLSAVRGKYKTYELWTFESVRNILINRIYTGDTVPFKSHVVKIGSNRVKMIPEEEQIVIPDTHEAIVSREVFYQAKCVIKSNKKRKNVNPKNILTGYLVCGCCGKKLTKGRSTNKDWLCATARYTDELGCGQIRLNENQMKEKLLSSIQVQCNMADASIEQIQAEQNEEAKALDQVRWNHRKAGKELEECSNRIMNLMDDYYEQKITKDEFVKEKAVIKEQESKLKSNVAELEQEMERIQLRISEQISKETDAGVISKHRNVEVLDEGIMKELVSKIVVFPDNVVRIQWNFAKL